MVRSKAYATDKLRRLQSVLWQVVAGAWREYEREYQHLRGNHRPGTQATIIHDLIAQQARNLLTGISGVVVIQQPQTIIVNVDDEWLLKFKLVRKGSLRAATNQTAFTGDFFSQQPMQLTLFDEPTHLVVGYVLNKTRSGMESVHVICPRDTKRNAWDFEIEMPQTQTQPISPVPRLNGPRVTPKAALPKPGEGDAQRGASNGVEAV